MPESSWFKRIWVNLTGHTSPEPIAPPPEPIAPPAGLTLLHTLEGHTDLVRSVAWSPDGQLLTSETGADVRIWRADTWEPLLCSQAWKASLLLSGIPVSLSW